MLNIISEKKGISNLNNLDDLIKKTIPNSVLVKDKDYDIGKPQSEKEAIESLKELASANQIQRSFIGQGYYDSVTPTVIQRNVLENPQWYTAYTPYQAEISQGRLEQLMNYQVMVGDLTGLPVVGASLLDEGTAAAEAMGVAFDNFLKSKEYRKSKGKLRALFFVSDRVHPQTIEVLRQRAAPRNIEIVISSINNGEIDFKQLANQYVEKHFNSNSDHDKIQGKFCGVLLQYPNTDGIIYRPKVIKRISKSIHDEGGLLICGTDLLALTLIKTPGELGVDIAVGNSQRFGVPLGYGGPHAGFYAAKQSLIRQTPGRIIGVSVDSEGNKAYRMALQTREQHIRRERATSNICTAQVLLANIAAFYGLYHGPEGLKAIANHVHRLCLILVRALDQLGIKTSNAQKRFFDTVSIDLKPSTADKVMSNALSTAKMNFRRRSTTQVNISLDEPTTIDDIYNIVEVFSSVLSDDNDNGVQDYRQVLSQVIEKVDNELSLDNIEKNTQSGGSSDSEDENQIRSLFSWPTQLRESEFMTSSIFSMYHSEHEMLRYINRLCDKDISLTKSMIPLGSCTMKLNATTEMIPISWPEFSSIHPFAPVSQTSGYRQLFRETEKMLSTLTGFDSVSLQPNAGSQGEFAGLLVIRKYLQTKGEGDRDICLIPKSAHGTNPASAAMAGLKVKVVNCLPNGDIDFDDLSKKCDQFSDRIAALMVTYPSTHGVFEENIRDVCNKIHSVGGQVYMDGANMNAQCGFTSPGDLGADVCHLNLHKTFCIPHGGGGPGIGPIGVAKHLTPHLPTHPIVRVGGSDAIGPISAAPWGSASIVPISYVYLRLMGTEGIKLATKYAILNANYMAARLSQHYPVLYSGENNLNAHEFIIDFAQIKKSSGIAAEDVSKRLMDFGFHSPTMSFPVTNTLMIEPTESESKEELDRFCDALIHIRKEIQSVEEGKLPKDNNPLTNAPHTSEVLLSDKFDNSPYSRQQAAYPLPWVKENKYWPPVSRIDNIHGDKHLNVNCPCEPISSYED